MSLRTCAVGGLLLVIFAGTAPAQPPAPAPAAAAPAPQGRGASPANSVVSPEVGGDRRVTFRIYAPNAQAVRLSAGEWELIWLATGKEDGLITTTVATVDLLKKHGFTPVYKETPGGQTWINWRNYLNEFVPQLFQ